MIEDDDNIHLLSKDGSCVRCEPTYRLRSIDRDVHGGRLLLLSDARLQGPGACWEQVCAVCRATVGIEDLVNARAVRRASSKCQHGRVGACELCKFELDSVAIDESPIAGWHPLPLGPATWIPAGVSMTLCASPMVPMRGPYRLRLVTNPLSSLEQIVLEELKFGQDLAVLGFGYIPGWALEDIDDVRPWASRAMPIAGRMLGLGMMVSITLKNLGAIPVQLTGVLYGDRMQDPRPEECHPPRWLPPARAKHLPLGDCAGRPLQLPGKQFVPSLAPAQRTFRGERLFLHPAADDELGPWWIPDDLPAVPGTFIGAAPPAPAPAPAPPLLMAAPLPPEPPRDPEPATRYTSDHLTATPTREYLAWMKRSEERSFVEGSEVWQSATDES